MPEIQVSLYASLRRYIDGAASTVVQVEPGCTIRQLIGQLGIPADQARVVMVNNRAAGNAPILARRLAAAWIARQREAERAAHG